ncbi:hypothetical protein E5A73_20355 [Sphingomonas gei]|uniref:MAE-28990/MAE-18760-like HEPN domain-containing protein n=1 Tax=Sphingomonas gei TaxID=1395960 RepID=A0A4S1WZZ5_9SPHN|nr:hypothetical protein [Sphingomonas gei]TGX49189.1 hypothetical protein E5A73_20355 [Sphingomonas gei]
MEFPDLAFAVRSEPLILYWPAPGVPLARLAFSSLEEWRRFVVGMALDPLIPDVVQRKFQRALKLFYLAWIDGDLMKAGELVALTALELALNDRYGERLPGRPRRKLKAGEAPSLTDKPPQRSFAALLKHMVDGAGLTDGDIPMIVRCGGTAVGQLIGSTKPTLADRRNALAHGDPFDGLPTSGLIELVRDLINFAYRSYIQAGRL